MELRFPALSLQACRELSLSVFQKVLLFDPYCACECTGGTGLDPLRRVTVQV